MSNSLWNTKVSNKFRQYVPQNPTMSRIIQSWIIHQLCGDHLSPEMTHENSCKTSCTQHHEYALVKNIKEVMFIALCKMYIFIMRLIHETDVANFFNIGALLTLRQKVDPIANLKILDKSIKRSTRRGGRCISREWMPPAENEPSWGFGQNQRYRRRKMNRVGEIQANSKIPPTVKTVCVNTSNGIQQNKSPKAYNETLKWFRYRRGKMNRVGVLQVCANTKTK